MKGLLRASLNIILGVVFGFGFLEAVFHTNPGLLFRGMSLPGPVDAPLTRQSYTVRYSDAERTSARSAFKRFITSFPALSFISLPVFQWEMRVASSWRAT